MNKNLFIGIGIFIVVAGALLFFLQSQKSNQQSSTATSSDQNPASQEVTSAPGYTGALLAGTNSPYLEFNKADYEKALSSDKIVFLDFFANWCPVCRDEAPEIESGFNELTTDQIVGFRVNFNDSETDEHEKALAKQFNIPYQHTKVILKKGKEVARSNDSWTKEDFLKEINGIL